MGCELILLILPNLELPHPPQESRLSGGRSVNGEIIFVRGPLIFAKPKKAKKIENPLLYPFRISPLPTRARKIVSKVFDFAD